MNPALRAGHALRCAVRPRGWIAFAAAVLCMVSAAAHAAPFVWDDDENGIDDRMETVHLLGYQWSFENGDTLARQRIEVVPAGLDLAYGAYVVFDHVPTTADFDTLQLIGMPVLYRFESIPVVRSLATFVQIQLAAAMSGVERVEAIPLLRPQVREAAASAGIRDATDRVFPTWSSEGGGDGTGTVVAILDSGINDAPVGDYPGHESLIGRCVGGASFIHPDSSLQTPPDGSVNPIDPSGSAHGTHVAGIVLGSGGPSGFAVGAAPGARFVDVRVLDETGLGTSIPEAIDWCIHNRQRDWDGDPLHAGIDVINLSVSSLDASDGNDVGARIANRAAELGIVVVASMGNESAAGYCPSPASGDRVIGVGAIDVQRTGDASDDLFASFSDYGPRADDGDGDPGDEQKPDLAASGVAVLSADGRLSGDGTQYRRLTGTSMSAAIVSGAVLLLRSGFPSLTPAGIGDLLRRTARRTIGGLPAAPPGADPRWNAPIGFGVLDLYAATLEALQSGHSQVRRLIAEPHDAQVDVEIWTQRELGATHFVLERRCADGGPSCPFAPVDSVAATGDGSLDDAVDLQAYALTVPIAPAEQGMDFDYRVSYTEAGVRYDGPARRVRHASGVPVAEVEVTLVHNAYDSDVDAALEVGGTEAAPALILPLGGTSSAVSSDWVNGASTLGNVAWTFRVPVPAAFAPYLPPDPGNPWRLRVGEGGFVNRSGRLTDFRVVDAAPGGQTWIGGPTPRQTLEGQTWWVATPLATSDVAPTGAPGDLRSGPNPVRAGATVRFEAGPAEGAGLSVFDLAGRRIALVPFTRRGDRLVGEWTPRDFSGAELRPGLYFARSDAGSVRPIVVLER